MAPGPSPTAVNASRAPSCHGARTPSPARCRPIGLSPHRCSTVFAAGGRPGVHTAMSLLTRATVPSLWVTRHALFVMYGSSPCRGGGAVVSDREPGQGQCARQQADVAQRDV